MIYAKGIDKEGFEDRAYRYSVAASHCVYPGQQDNNHWLQSVAAGSTTMTHRIAPTASLGAPCWLSWPQLAESS